MSQLLPIYSRQIRPIRSISEIRIDDRRFGSNRRRISDIYCIASGRSLSRQRPESSPRHFSVLIFSISQLPAPFATARSICRKASDVGSQSVRDLIWPEADILRGNSWGTISVPFSSRQLLLAPRLLAKFLKSRARLNSIPSALMILSTTCGLCNPFGDPLAGIANRTTLGSSGPNLATCETCAVSCEC
jgi:hypothetical protein